MTLEHYQTAFQPLLYGVALAHRSHLPSQGNRTAARPRQRESRCTTRGNMTRETGTGKYEQPARALSGPGRRSQRPLRIRAKKRRWPAPSRPPSKRADHRRSSSVLQQKIREVAEQHGHRSRQHAHRRCAAQPRVRREGGRAGALGRSRAADEGQPAQRRAPRRRGRARDRTAHGPPHQSRVHHGRADLSQGAVRHRRGHQHRADARRQGRHLPERDRPRGRARPRASRRSRSSRRSKRSTPRCRRRSMPPRCARWPTAAKSRAGCSTARSPSTTPSAGRGAHQGHPSEVAGDPDILLVPDLEAGNILAKQLTFLANADSAGLVLGARVPIILTSRADSVRSRIASCAVAMLAAHARRRALQAAV